MISFFPLCFSAISPFLHFPHLCFPVCIYINKQANTGPNLDRKKIQQLPDHFGPDRPSVVLQQAVQGCIDSAFQQKTVFTLLTQGYGGEKISGVVQRPPSGVAICLFNSFFSTLPKVLLGEKKILKVSLSDL